MPDRLGHDALMAFTLKIGDQAPDFDLPAVDGQRYGLASFAGQPLLVVVFSCNHCPYAIGSEERLNQLFVDYRGRGVEMITINSNEEVNHPTDSFDHMIERARERGFAFPYARDAEQTTALAYGALRTPHFYVFDADRKLRYTGRMDDNPKDAALATTHELRDAIESLLDDDTVAAPVTNPIGCNVKWSGQEAHWMPPEACDLVPTAQAN